MLFRSSNSATKEILNHRDLNTYNNNNFQQVASVNTLCKSVLNVKKTVIKNSNLYSDKNGVKHIRIQARPDKWHENDCSFRHKSCPVL